MVVASGLAGGGGVCDRVGLLEEFYELALIKISMGVVLGLEFLKRRGGCLGEGEAGEGDLEEFYKGGFFFSGGGATKSLSGLSAT